MAATGTDAGWSRVLPPHSSTEAAQGRVRDTVNDCPAWTGAPCPRPTPALSPARAGPPSSSLPTMLLPHSASPPQSRAMSGPCPVCSLGPGLPWLVSVPERGSCWLHGPLLICCPAWFWYRVWKLCCVDGMYFHAFLFSVSPLLPASGTGFASSPAGSPSRPHGPVTLLLPRWLVLPRERGLRAGASFLTW